MMVGPFAVDIYFFWAFSLNQVGFRLASLFNYRVWLSLAVAATLR